MQSEVGWVWRKDSVQQRSGGGDGQGFRASWIWRAGESQDECHSLTHGKDPDAGKD